jgi:hypothetical protein
VSPHDDMAQYLCAERPTQILGQEPAPERGGHERGGHGLPGPARGDSGRGGHGLPAASHDAPRQNRDPIRAGRDALLASLDRPLGQNSGRGLDPAAHSDSRRPVSGGAAALLGGGSGSAFDDDADLPKEVPAVPSLAVLRPRRTVGQGGQGNQSAMADQGDGATKPRKRLPSWDDVLFGGGPAARESS